MAMSRTESRLMNEMELAHDRCRWACRINGVVFLGIQSGWGLVEDQCLFARKKGSTTLAIPLSKVTPLAIAWRIFEADEKFRNLGQRVRAA